MLKLQAVVLSGSQHCAVITLIWKHYNTVQVFKFNDTDNYSKTIISKQASVGIENLCAMCFKAFCTKAPLTSHLITFTQVRNDDNKYFSI